jgi:hypothetical protein
MQQLLAAHQIPARIVDLGLVSYVGAGSPAALQVHPDDRLRARMLLSPLRRNLRRKRTRKLLCLSSSRGGDLPSKGCLM